VNIKNVRGFSAWPPKNTDLGFVIYYDGMEGGIARATNYMGGKKNGHVRQKTGA
jgi:hypothetical protein